MARRKDSLEPLGQAAQILDELAADAPALFDRTKWKVTRFIGVVQLEYGATKDALAILRRAVEEISES